MARTKTNTRNDTKTLTTSLRIRHLDKLYFCVFKLCLAEKSIITGPLIHLTNRW